MIVNHTHNLRFSARKHQCQILCVSPYAINQHPAASKQTGNINRMVNLVNIVDTIRHPLPHPLFQLTIHRHKHMNHRLIRHRHNSVSSYSICTPKNIADLIARIKPHRYLLYSRMTMTKDQEIAVEPKVPKAARVPYIDPASGAPLREHDGKLISTINNQPCAVRRDSVMDFIQTETYAESFTFQWNQTKAIRTQSKALQERHREEMNLRTGFDRLDLKGMTCLEVGAGLGDDTDYLLEQGIDELHAIDLSGSIFRAAKLVPDPRVRYARADVNQLPFAPESFDVVICHRMMQHTPHPAATLARVSKMVKPGGLLFVHSYHKSKYFQQTSKYKYRWITTRLPRPLLWHTLAFTAPVLRRITETIAQISLFNGRFDGNEFARRWSPWVLQAHHTIHGTDRRTLLQYETQITFDSLTPKYDLPMYANDFQDLIESMGFEIMNIERRPWFPLWATARRQRNHT